MTTETSSDPTRDESVTHAGGGAEMHLEVLVKALLEEAKAARKEVQELSGRVQAVEWAMRPIARYASADRGEANGVWSGDLLSRYSV